MSEDRAMSVRDRMTRLRNLADASERAILDDLINAWAAPRAATEPPPLTRETLAAAQKAIAFLRSCVASGESLSDEDNLTLDEVARLLTRVSGLTPTSAPEPGS